jgi:hypothetical protein
MLDSASLDQFGMCLGHRSVFRRCNKYASSEESVGAASGANIGEGLAPGPRKVGCISPGPNAHHFKGAFGLSSFD